MEPDRDLRLSLPLSGSHWGPSWVLRRPSGQMEAGRSGGASGLLAACPEPSLLCGAARGARGLAAARPCRPRAAVGGGSPAASGHLPLGARGPRGARAACAASPRALVPAPSAAGIPGRRRRASPMGRESRSAASGSGGPREPVRAPPKGRVKDGTVLSGNVGGTAPGGASSWRRADRPRPPLLRG